MDCADIADACCLASCDDLLHRRSNWHLHALYAALIKAEATANWSAMPAVLYSAEVGGCAKGSCCPRPIAWKRLGL